VGKIIPCNFFLVCLKIIIKRSLFFLLLLLFIYFFLNICFHNSLPLFTAAAASLCVQVKGAIPSMPDRKSVMDLLHSL
jgi:hypothetical protein